LSYDHDYQGEKDNHTNQRLHRCAGKATRAHYFTYPRHRFIRARCPRFYFRKPPSVSMAPKCMLNGEVSRITKQCARMPPLFRIYSRHSLSLRSIRECMTLLRLLLPVKKTPDNSPESTPIGAMSPHSRLIDWAAWLSFVR
jgi:hypothetical protein